MGYFLCTTFHEPELGGTCWQSRYAYPLVTIAGSERAAYEELLIQALTRASEIFGYNNDLLSVLAYSPSWNGSTLEPQERGIRIFIKSQAPLPKCDDEMQWIERLLRRMNSLVPVVFVSNGPLGDLSAIHANVLRVPDLLSPKMEAIFADFIKRKLLRFASANTI